MLLVAVKNHTYRGRRIKVGEKYTITSPADARLLKLAGLVREVVVRETREKTREIRPREPEPEPESEIEEQEEQPSEQSETDESSSRQRRRRYKRHDMVPEK